MADETWVVTMPKLGETVTEGTVGSWLKNVGDTVEFDDPLFEVSTDKVDSEIPSPYDGVILDIMVQAGETVPVGTDVVRIGPPGSTPGESAPADDSASQSADTDSGEATDATQDEGESGMAEGAGVANDITMPKLGETVTEGTIGSWLKSVGDTVEFDDPLYEVSTDKVDSEIPSPYDGVLLEILVEAGETVPVGTVVARVGEPGAQSSSSGEVADGAPAKGDSAQPAGSRDEPSATPGAAAGKNYSPIVRRLAAENDIDLSAVTGTGEGGRIRREDVQAAIEDRPARGAAPAPSKPTAPAAAPASAAPAPAAGGPAGARPQTDIPAVPGVPDDRDEVKPLSKMRLAIASGMVQSLQISPQVWTSVEVDYENIEITRAKYKEGYRKATGASLSYMTFVARVLPDLLMKYPAINSSVDVPNKTQTFHPYVNLGIAVDLDEQGLMVPVVKNADQLNLKGLGMQIKEIAAGTRAGKLSADAYKGSTFTITNVGPFQSYASAPIINQPNVAILCTEGVSRKPVAIGNTIAIHSVGILSLVYDHRAFDGSTASKFLFDLRNALQDREWDAELGG